MSNRKKAARLALARLDGFEDGRAAGVAAATEEAGQPVRDVGALYVPTAEERRFIFGYASTTPQTLRDIRTELEAMD